MHGSLTTATGYRTITSLTADYGEVVDVQRYYDGTIVVTYRPRNSRYDRNVYYPPIVHTVSPTTLFAEPPRLPPRKRPFYPEDTRAPIPTRRPTAAPPVRPEPRLLHYANPRVQARRNKPMPKQPSRRER